MNISLKSIEYYLPDKIISNFDIHKNHPDWEIEKVAEKSGVFFRHIAKDNETAFDLARNATSKLFESNSINPNDIDGLIFCTQSPDYIMPSNAFLIHKDFGLNETVWAFDYNLACSGFIYGLAIVRGMILSGMGKNILLINSDTYSKYINKNDRSASILFGDAATVTLLTENNEPGIIDIELASSGAFYDYFYIPAGGSRVPKNSCTSKIKIDNSGNGRSMNDIHMNGFGVWKFISQIVPNQISNLLKRNHLSFDDIDLIIFHQASKLTLDSLVKALKINPAKVYMNIDKVGNTVSASIPLAIKYALNEGKLKRGNLVLLSGFGVGISWGSIIFRY